MKPVAILLNPSSGRGRSLRKRKAVERMFTSFGIGFDLFVSSSEDHLRELADRAGRGYRSVVAVGGDTTFGIVAGRILCGSSEVRPALGMVGTGSANDVCRGLGIARIQSLCRAIIDRQVRRMDVGTVQVDQSDQEWIFLGSMSLGLGTVVNRSLEKFARKHPHLARVDAIGQNLAGALGVFRAFSRRQVPLTVKLVHDAGAETLTFSLLVLLNTGYFANGLHLSPDASPFDGLLDGVAVNSGTFGQTLGFQRAVHKGTHVHRHGFRMIRSASFTLESEDGIDIQLDGEVIRDVKGCRVSVRKAALDVFAPEGYNANC